MTEEQLIKRPIKYELYKTKGAFQFKLVPAYTIKDKKTNKPKEKGYVFIDAAPATGERQYGFQDDSKKITFALGVADIGLILAGFKAGKFNLVHDPQAQTENQGKITKQLSMWKGNNDNDGLPTYFIKITESSNGVKKEVSIPLKTAETEILLRLLSAAISKILYWD